MGICKVRGEGMKVNLRLTKGKGKDKDIKTVIEEFDGDWENNEDHGMFRQKMYQKHEGYSIVGYAIRDEAPSH
jgi:hypothetical protein